MKSHSQFGKFQSIWQAFSSSFGLNFYSTMWASWVRGWSTQLNDFLLDDVKFWNENGSLSVYRVNMVRLLLMFGSDCDFSKRALKLNKFSNRQAFPSKKFSFLHTERISDNLRVNKLIKSFSINPVSIRYILQCKLTSSYALLITWKYSESF